MSSFSMLSFDENGIPTTITSIEDCERAIAAGRIGAGTAVTIFLTNGEAVRVKAEESPFLAPYFAPAEPEPVQELPTVPKAPKQKSSAEKTAPPPEEFDRGLVLAEQSNDVVERQEPGEEVQKAAAPPERAVIKDPPPNRPLQIAIGVVGLGFLAWLAGLFNGDQDQPIPDSGASAAAEAAAAVAEAEPEPQTLYAVADLRVRYAPTVGGEPEIWISRGTALTGILVPGLRDPNFQWMKLTSGEHSGRYVSAVNLGPSLPPAIDTSTAGDYRLIGEAVLRAEPVGDSPSRVGSDARLAAASKVTVAGTVNGEWAEVKRNKGGVGYLPWSALGGTGGEYRSIYLVNRCNRAIRNAFLYRVGSDWQMLENWAYSMSPGQAYFVTDKSNTRVQTNSPEIYYHEVPSTDGYIYWNGGQKANIYGQNVEMKRAVPVQNGNGDYQITFC